MKNKLFVVCALASSFFSVVNFTTTLTSAAAPTPSKEKLEKISKNCGTIRQNLKLLQRSDSRARTYFGAIYEVASSKYITPLNLRLVKNDLSSVSLINIQTSLASSRADFSSDFIDYSRALEELVAFDCNLYPEEFYEKLVSTREKRAKVASDMKLINDLLINSVKSVEQLKENLDAREK